MQNIVLNSEQDTIKLAETIAKDVKKNTIILLYGGLGVGKTFFTNVFINYFNKIENRKVEDITSPTFNIFKTYKTNNFDIFHFDLYRIKDVEELYELDIEDAFNNVAIIEWPEIIENILPYKTISMFFSLENNVRHCKIKIEEKSL